MYTPKTINKFITELKKTEYRYKNIKSYKTFNGKDAVLLLMKNKMGKEFLDYLLQQNIICGGKIDDKQVEPFLLKKFNEKNSYIIIKEPTDWRTIIYAFLIITLSIVLAMYQVWPQALRSKTIYLLYLFIAFTTFIFILAIIRLFIFSYLFLTGKRIWWLFPNLFADVGFFESFKPLWKYSDEK